jgi:hypothetical protein
MQRKTKKNKATAPTEGSNADTAERKKLVLHLRVAKDSEVGRGKGDEKARTGPTGPDSVTKAENHAETVVRSLQAKPQRPTPNTQQQEISRRMNMPLLRSITQKNSLIVQPIIETIQKKEEKASD